MQPTQEELNAQRLQEELNGYQVTDDQGQIDTENENFVEESVPQEQTTVEDTATAEKPPETEGRVPKTQTEETENELAEDETGKRYVPEDRFNKVYGKQKALERELEALRKQAQAQQPTQPEQPIRPFIPGDRAEALETELLFATLPQFNPNRPDQYNKKLDALGAKIFQATPGITKLEAARQAIAIAKDLTSDQAQAIAEARQVKSQTADQGITSRVVSRQSQKPDVNRMSLEEKEEYLRATGEWDKF